VQQLVYPVPPERLHDIWQTVLETVEQPSLQHFKGVTILLYAKFEDSYQAVHFDGHASQIRPTLATEDQY
jgi:hypothetical protein